MFLFSEDKFCNSVFAARQRRRLNSKVGNNGIIQMMFEQCDQPGSLKKKKTKCLAIKVRISSSPIMKNASIPETHA